MNKRTVEIGVYTLGAMLPDPMTCRTITAKQRIQDIIAAAQLADEAGLDVFGVGEHHRSDFAVSGTNAVLSAIAQTTKRIRLTSASTVLSTADPVKLFEDFATLDLISNGRTEIIAGKGAFTESYPLFGYDFKDKDKLFDEKLNLLIQINKNEKISWNGEFRSPLNEALIYPRPEQVEIPIWVAVGNNMESAVKAGQLGQRLALIMLGGHPSRVKPIVEAYKRSGIEAGYTYNNLKISISCHGYISADFMQAKNESFHYYSNYYKHFTRRSGVSDTLLKDDYEQLIGLETSLLVGDPERIIDKLLNQYEIFKNNRFMIHLDFGGIPYTKVAKAIELLATRIAPELRSSIKFNNV